MKTEKEKYFEYIKKQHEKGMISISHTRTILDGLKLEDNEEELFAELNRMANACDRADKEVLGKYSL